jgi:hypothetical protein
MLESQNVDVNVHESSQDSKSNRNNKNNNTYQETTQNSSHQEEQAENSLRNSKIPQETTENTQEHSSETTQHHYSNQQETTSENIDDRQESDDHMQSKDKAVVEAVHCTGVVDGYQTKIILDTGSVGSVISMHFLRQIQRDIDGESKVVMTGVSGTQQRSLGKVYDVPITLGKGQTLATFDVTEARHFTILLGNDWLTKVKADICFQDQLLKYSWRQHNYVVPITCWDRLTYDVIKLDTSPPHSRNNNEDNEEDNEEDDEEEYEDEEDLVMQNSLSVIGSHQEKPIVMMTHDQLHIGERLYPNSYYWEVKHKVHSIPNSRIHVYWKGPRTVCWCDHYLETEEDTCVTCKQLYDDWEVLKHLPEEDIPEKPRNFLVNQAHDEAEDEATPLTQAQEKQLQKLLEGNEDLFAADLKELGRTSIVKHEIPMQKNVRPIQQRAYRRSPAENKFIQGEIQSMLENGII